MKRAAYDPTPQHRRNQKPGGELGLPQNCQLGRLIQHRECKRPFVKRIGNCRLCQHHLDLVNAIKRDAQKCKRIAKKPRTQMYRSAA